MITINAGCYPIYHGVVWWNQVPDVVRRREVADALGLPADAVEIVTDSDEEVDLASVWLVTDGDERAIGHVTTETDGMIVVEILDDMKTETELDRETAWELSNQVMDYNPSAISSLEILEDYSGRDMFGDTTIAFVVDGDLNEFYLLLGYAAATLGVDVSKLPTRHDNLGLHWVVY